MFESFGLEHPKSQVDRSIIHVNLKAMLSQSLERHLGLKPGKALHLLVSCSGGPDSVALLHVCKELRQRYENLRVSALHIHFGLRAQDSDEDALFVQDLCRSWGLSCLLHYADWNPKTVNQERTRNLRIQLSERVLPEALWLEAHHQDDQVETLLFRLFRSTGLKGLEGMKSPSLRKSRMVWRPFLAFRKSDLLEYLQQHQLSYRLDQSNFKCSNQRNWIRNELIPSVETKFPDFRASLLRIRDQVEEENRYFEQKMASLLEASVRRLQPLTLDRRILREVEPLFLDRFVHWLFGEHFQIVLSREKVRQLSEILRSLEEAQWNAPRGLHVKLKKEQVSFEPASRALPQGVQKSV